MADGKENRRDIYSKAVRAGKRTYFFDIKATKSNDLYLTITESKKRFQEDGKFFFEKHKLFLYKEDFDKFSNGLEEAIAHIAELRSDENSDFAAENREELKKNMQQPKDDLEKTSKAISDIDFDDLG